MAIDDKIQSGYVFAQKGIAPLNNVSHVDPRMARIFDSKMHALAVLDADPFFQRVEGLEMKVREEGTIVKYMFKNGISDEHFVKSSTFTVTGDIVVDGDKHYTYPVNFPTDNLQINHALGKGVNVTIYDEFGEQLYARVYVVDDNNVRIESDIPFTGRIEIN